MVERLRYSYNSYNILLYHCLRPLHRSTMQLQSQEGEVEEPVCKVYQGGVEQGITIKHIPITPNLIMVRCTAMLLDIHRWGIQTKPINHTMYLAHTLQHHLLQTYPTPKAMDTLKDGTNLPTAGTRGRDIKAILNKWSTSAWIKNVCMTVDFLMRNE